MSHPPERRPPISVLAGGPAAVGSASIPMAAPAAARISPWNASGGANQLINVRHI